MSDDEDAIAGVQLESVSSKNPLVDADGLLREGSKPPAPIGLAPTVPTTPNPPPTPPPRGLRVDSVGIAVALNSQRSMPKPKIKVGGGRGGRGATRASPGAASRAAAFKKTSEPTQLLWIFEVGLQEALQVRGRREVPGHSQRRFPTNF